MIDNLVVLSRLAIETRGHHVEADADLERLLSSLATGQDYRRFLSRLYGFLVPLEVALDATPNLACAIDLRPRHKAYRLRSDLMALGVRIEQIANLPLCRGIPHAFRAPAPALGWMYVIERSTLLHTAVYRQLARSLPGEIAFASSYLKCYEGTVSSMWRGFGEALDVACGSSAAEAVSAAQEAFRCLRNWGANAGRSGRWTIQVSRSR
ncbi:MAG: bacteriophytochrome heme oxygenase BphO [Myxococcales bacterium]|nr:bacteriophytochrome heme oxygenase BphO [Myxococcales bacterium]